MRAQTTTSRVVGAGFAGLACARAAARRGLRVLVVDRKAEPGARMHTTGLVVKEAAERWEIPATLTRRVRGIRLYSPSLATLDLHSAGYYFLATDTPALMRWFAREAARAGAHLRFGRPWRGAERIDDGFVLDGGERVRYLVGADGPRRRSPRTSASASIANSCWASRREYRDVRGVDADRLHCFLDATLAPRLHRMGGARLNGLVQVGSRAGGRQRPDLPAFERKLAPVFDFTNARRVGRRGGLIPVGGPVSPMAARDVVLIGDAAGIVSPLSAGGIHTALDSGFTAAHAIADHLLEGAGVPDARRAARAGASRRSARCARCSTTACPTAVFDAALSTRAFTALARSVYFHHRGLRSADGLARSRADAVCAAIRESRRRHAAARVPSSAGSRFDARHVVAAQELEVAERVRREVQDVARVARDARQGAGSAHDDRGPPARRAAPRGARAERAAIELPPSSTSRQSLPRQLARAARCAAPASRTSSARDAPAWRRPGTTWTGQARDRGAASARRSRLRRRAATGARCCSRRRSP